MTDRDDSLPGPRHAAPRVSVRSRIRGRAMAMAAVPTALIVGAAYTPTTPAVAETQAGKACASAPDTVLDETPVPKSEIAVQPTRPASATSVPTTVPTATKGPTATPSPTSSATVKLPVPTSTATAAKPNAVAAPAAASPSATADTQAHGLIGDILDGILHPGGQSPAPTATPSTATPTKAPAAETTTPAAAPKPTATQAVAPRAAASSAAPTVSASASASKAASAAPTASATPSPSATGPNCLVDTSGAKAAAAPGGDVVPDQNWTLRSSKLALHGSVFNGVYDVRTPTGTKRVLKFTTASVDIGDLDMSTIEVKGKTFHVQAAPGTTSTMRNGPITMYVESLSGHLSAVYGLPIPIDLGEITLTPDTLPKWLWDLIGTVPIPLDLTLDDAKAVQAGQFGGTLKIPGMHLFNDDAPYED
ncbi:hypothetical protein [Kitasatospora sp. NBC_01539]|uniref:hypothetical protein n=1 Tax=Kitasatospora sp. NBC_01539 TaxID=2903577 RepID=UPI00386013B7